MKKIKVIKTPDITVYNAVIVDKNTELSYKNEYVNQTVKKLKLHSITYIKGDGYKGKYDTTVELKEGDILVFDGDKRGYVKPVESMTTIDEAIEDLKVVKEV